METEKRFEIWLSDWESSEVEIQEYVKDFDFVTCVLHRPSIGHYILTIFTSQSEWLEYSSILRDNKERFFSCCLPKPDFFLPTLFKQVDLQIQLIEANYVY